MNLKKSTILKKSKVIKGNGEIPTSSETPKIPPMQIISSSGENLNENQGNKLQDLLDNITKIDGGSSEGQEIREYLENVKEKPSESDIKFVKEQLRKLRENLSEDQFSEEVSLIDDLESMPDDKFLDEIRKINEN